MRPAGHRLRRQPARLAEMDRGHGDGDVAGGDCDRRDHRRQLRNDCRGRDSPAAESMLVKSKK